MKNYKEVGLQERVKFVLNAKDVIGFTSNDVESVLGAINYAGKKDLRLPRDSSITLESEAEILGTTMILDLHIPLKDSKSSNVWNHEEEFFQSVENYLSEGVHHKTSGNYLGGFGNVSFNVVAQNPTRKVTVTFETDMDAESVIILLQRNGAKDIKIV